VSPSLYVYGIVAAGAIERIERTGVGAQPVRLVEGGAVTALGSPLAGEELRVRRRDLQAHLEVLKEAFGRTTVVPLRFGTVLESESAVREELLGEREAQLLELLARLEGHAQLELTAVYEEDEVLRELVAGDREIAALREYTRDGGADDHAARVRLGELVAGALEARRERDAAAILAVVEPHVAEVVVDRRRQDRVFKGSLLVRNDAVPALEQALEELAAAQRARMRLELAGPLPPTAFVETVDAEAGAWA
jgi:hypothetical protein